MEKIVKRKFIKLTDIAIIVVLIAVCTIVLILMENCSHSKLIAQISYNGKIVKEIELDTALDVIFELSENKNVSFQVSDQKIRFVNTNCPDKLCENFEYLDKANDVAICLPNKVSLKLVGDKEEIDILVN
ncbi:MAG: NusG domain II-containing protein [Oscillospiraceae bacterium]